MYTVRKGSTDLCTLLTIYSYIARASAGILICLNYNLYTPCIYVFQQEQELLRTLEAEEVLRKDSRKSFVAEEQNLHQLEERRYLLQQQIDTYLEEVQ